MELPEALRVALNELAADQPPRALAAAAASLSAAYRTEGGASSIEAITSAEGAVAYAVTRLPATFAALAAVLGETALRLPDWRPTTLLDAGAGPGVSIWTAGAIWPSLTRATLLDRDQRMTQVGRRLLADAGDAGEAGAETRDAIGSHVSLDITCRQADLTGDWGRLDAAPFDLCICSYALNELPHAQRLRLVERLWATCGGALALVAPGTPAGFAAIREARAWLINAGGQIVAPCPHAEACPMPPGDWCHFAQRLARSRLHRQLKGGDAPFEDEKFSYVVAARPTLAPTPIAARVIRRPLIHSGHITLDLCAPGGLARAEVTRSQRDVWRAARDARWGASLAKLPVDTRGM